MKKHSNDRRPIGGLHPITHVFLVLPLSLLAACSEMPEEATAPVELRVVSANPVGPGLTALAERFEETTGQVVRIDAMGTASINALLASDEAADILVGTTAMVDQAVSDGLAEGGKTPAGRVGIGIYVRNDLEIPDVSTPERVREAALAADGVIFNTAGSGQAVGRMFDGLDIGAEVTAKEARPGNAEETVERIVDGEGEEIGFGLLSELRSYVDDGTLEFAGRLPEALQSYLVYDAVVLARSATPEDAAEFIDFITTPEAREVFRSTGVD